MSNYELRSIYDEAMFEVWWELWLLELKLKLLGIKL